MVVQRRLWSRTGDSSWTRNLLRSHCPPFRKTYVSRKADKDHQNSLSRRAKTDCSSQHNALGQFLFYFYWISLHSRRKEKEKARQNVEIYLNHTILYHRQVGICLKHLPTFNPGSTEHYFHDDNVPWQRVINAKGVISPRSVDSFCSRFDARGFVNYFCVLRWICISTEVLEVLPDRQRLYVGKESQSIRGVWGNWQWILVGLGGFRICCRLRRLR